MSRSRKQVQQIKWSAGAEIYIGHLGHVCIRQPTDGAREEQIVSLPPEQIPALIRHLRKAHREATQYARNEEI